MHAREYYLVQHSEVSHHHVTPASSVGPALLSKAAKAGNLTARTQGPEEVTDLFGWLAENV